MSRKLAPMDGERAARIVAEGGAVWLGLMDAMKLYRLRWSDVLPDLQTGRLKTYAHREDPRLVLVRSDDWIWWMALHDELVKRREVEQ